MCKAQDELEAVPKPAERSQDERLNLVVFSLPLMLSEEVENIVGRLVGTGKTTELFSIIISVTYSRYEGLRTHWSWTSCDDNRRTPPIGGGALTSVAP
jgi:hypothetical protein